MFGNELLDFTIIFLTIARCGVILKEFACSLLIRKPSKISFV